MEVLIRNEGTQSCRKVLKYTVGRLIVEVGRGTGGYCHRSLLKIHKTKYGSEASLDNELGVDFQQWDVPKNFHIWGWKERFRHPSFFVVGIFEVCIRGFQNFVGFFEKIFWQALWQKLPSVGGRGSEFFWNVLISYLQCNYNIIIIWLSKRLGRDCN